jgi:hypothetical protein
MKTRYPQERRRKRRRKTDVAVERRPGVAMRALLGAVTGGAVMWYLMRKNDR